ncbi:hypothetical protein BC830DRAFT_1045533, partial [Chytriomyces sp. MP71]
GGLSGLSAAWFLAQANRSVQVTVLESSPRLGGWVDTRRLEDGAVLEAGPRTLRPNGIQGSVTLDLVHRLGLEKEVVAVPKSSPAARNRFIKFNGKLDKMPTSLTEALFPPSDHVFRGVLARGALEPFVSRSGLRDESIHDFVSRRFGKHVAENMISALVHGIYAGDSRVLSVKSCFSVLWEAEQKHGSVVRSLVSAAFDKTPEKFPTDISPESLAFIKRIKACSVYAFKNGLQTFTDAIRLDLEKNHPQIQIVSNAKATKLENTPNGIQVTTDSGSSISASHVISSLPSHALSPLLPVSSAIPPILNQTPFVDVAVVNLLFNDPNLLSIEGFGYLVPRTQKSSVIGVIFDSVAVPGQDARPATRLTCMMGGHRFKEVFPDGFSETQCLALAREALRDDLGVRGDPVATRVSLQRQCIPQYTVGHAARMHGVHEALLGEFGGNLSVVGSSYLGVGVNDCVLSSKNVVQRLEEGAWDAGVTGLEKF